MSWYISLCRAFIENCTNTRGVVVTTAIGYIAGNDNWTRQISEAPPESQR